MPEGDTVWRACKRLNQALAGQILVRTDFRVPSLATTDLSGRTVSEVVARGKHILMRLSGGVTVHSHFRMDGSWHLYRPGERWRGGPGHEIRAVRRHPAHEQLERRHIVRVAGGDVARRHRQLIEVGVQGGGSHTAQVPAAEPRVLCAILHSARCEVEQQSRVV